MRAAHILRDRRRSGVVLLVAAALLATAAGQTAAESAQGAANSAKNVGPALAPAKKLTAATDVASPLKGVFGPTSVWKQNVVKAPVAPNSAALVRNLASQVSSHWGGVGAFNVWQYNTSFYRVPAGQAKVDVKWWNCQNKTYEPRGLLGPNGQFSGVPIPPDAVPAAGTDGSLTIYDPSTDTMWDFWKASKRADGWYACWGGRMDRVSKSPGYFNNGFGTTATGLSSIGGSVGVREAQAGVIEHALALQVV